MTNINNAKTLATAATTSKAPKGRHDLNHGCNPCAETTSARYRGKPCLLLLILALLAVATTARAQVTVFHDNVKYVLYNDGTAYVDLSPGAWGTLNLRETVSYNSLTCTVTRIADGAFFNNYQITGNLVIPNTVTHIGSEAFRGCSGLNGTLTLPDGLLTIGSGAFYQCTGLTGTLNLPATLTSIGNSAFMDCNGFSWSTLTLPPLLTEIATQTFAGIQFTGDLVVPDGVTAIGNDAFTLNKFSSITIGNGVTTIGHHAFRLTMADQLTLGSSVASIGDEAFRYYDEDITHNHILNIKCLNAVPATLGQNVFQYHTQWMVEVPCGARDAYIHSAGWPQGGALLPLGHNISELCPTTNACINGIYYTLKLYDGTAKVTNKDYTEDYATVSYSGDVVIPAEVTYEGTTFTVTEIVDRAFALCQGITSITCFCPVPPQGGGNAFTGVPRIPLYVPCRVVSAYQSNYYYQSKFSVIGIPEYQNVQIGGVYYVLNYCDGTATVTHAGYSEDDSNSGSYSGYVAIPGTVTYNGETHVVNRIGNNAFKGCVSLTDAIIGENVETIGDNAFERCTALTYVSMGHVENIGDAAFKGCTALTSVTIGENVENIGNNAFDGCTALSSITSERLDPPALGSDVFSGVPTSAVLNVPCTATDAYAAAAQWQDFNIQGTVLAPINAQIDGVYYVLNPCAGTATVTHAGYDEIANAYYQNSYSGAVTIPATVTHEGRTYDVTRIGQWAFFISLNLTSVIIGENVIHISPYAFNGCSALTSVIIGENVNTINYYAFNGCSSLGSITSLRPVPPTLIGDYVFRNVPTSAVLYVPCSAVEAYAAAGGWNRFETISEIYYQIGDIYYSICNGTATVVHDDSYATLEAVMIDESITVNETDYYVTAIADGAFDGCEHLKWFDCHANLLSIGDHAFRNCDSLNYLGLYQTDTPPTLGEGCFEGLGLDTLRLIVPYCSQYDYSQHPVFGQFGEILGSGPCEYNFYNATGDNQWDNPANWQDANHEPCTEAPGVGARVGIFDDCEIDTDVTVGSITIGNYIDEYYGLYERLTVKDGATLTATDFIYTTGDARNFIIEDGAQVIHPNAGAKATVQKNITGYVGEKDNYYLIGYSFVGSGAVDDMDNLTANEYDLYFYDEPTHYWMNQKQTANNFTELEVAKGYLYANSQTQTIGLKGTLEAGDAMVNVPLSYASADGKLMGFNLVGNPFAHNVTAFAGNDVATDVYQLNDLRNEVVVGSISETNPLKPGEGFFVKAMAEDASITFNSRATNAERSNITLELSENGLIVDRFILKRDGAPLEKFTLNENGTKIYATEDGQDWAVAVIASEAKQIEDSTLSQSSRTEQPVNFKAAQNGTYTLTVNVENMDLDYLHLIDNMTGADVDLLGDARHCVSTAYTFAAKTTDYASRFRLVFSTNCGDAIGDNAPFAYVSNGNIVVVGDAVGDAGTASLQVVDLMGRVLVCRDAFNASAISTTGIPAGVYVLRLVDGENVRTQKVVID